MPHWRRQYRPPDRLQMAVHSTVDTIGFVTYLVAFLGLIVLIFISTPKAKAATVCQPNQIEGLSELARDLGVKASQAPTISTGIGCDGKPYDFIALLRAHVKLVRDKK